MKNRNNNNNDKEPGSAQTVEQYIKSMNEDDVCAWLEYVFGESFCDKTGVKDIFRNNYINGQVLMSFDKKMLTDLNVGNSIQQKRFYLEIENLRNMKSLDQKLVLYIQEKKKQSKKKKSTIATRFSFTAWFICSIVWICIVSVLFQTK